MTKGNEHMLQNTDIESENDMVHKTKKLQQQKRRAQVTRNYSDRALALWYARYVTRKSDFEMV